MPLLHFLFKRGRQGDAGAPPAPARTAALLARRPLAALCCRLLLVLLAVLLLCMLLVPWLEGGSRCVEELLLLPGEPGPAARRRSCDRPAAGGAVALLLPGLSATRPPASSGH
jgi:hypothetical protein